MQFRFIGRLVAEVPHHPVDTGFARAFERSDDLIIQGEQIGRVAFHYVIHDYLVRVRGGTLAAADDAANVRWVAADELATLPLTDGLAAVLDIAREMR